MEFGEVLRFPHVDHAQPRLLVADPRRELEGGDVVLLRLDASRQRGEVDARTRGRRIAGRERGDREHRRGAGEEAVRATVIARTNGLEHDGLETRRWNGTKSAFADCISAFAARSADGRGHDAPPARARRSQRSAAANMPSAIATSAAVATAGERCRRPGRVTVPRGVLP